MAFVVGMIALLVAEIWAVIQVAHVVGVVVTILLLVLAPIMGVRIVKVEGLAALRRVQEKVAAQELPGNALLDGLVVLIAGVLIAVPGFITDALGLLLLLPPVRVAARTAIKWVLFRRVRTTTIRYYD